MARQRFTNTRRAVEQFTAAIGAGLIERVGTVRAKCALEGADERAALIGRQIGAAALTVRPHLKHRAYRPSPPATSATVAQMRWTTSRT